MCEDWQSLGEILAAMGIGVKAHTDPFAQDGGAIGNGKEAEAEAPASLLQGGNAQRGQVHRIEAGRKSNSNPPESVRFASGRKPET